MGNTQLTDKELNELAADKSEPLQARLAREVLDLRFSSKGFETKAKELHADRDRLERKVARLEGELHECKTLLENAQTALHDAIKRGAA